MMCSRRRRRWPTRSRSRASRRRCRSVEWPNLPHAARLILSRPGEIDGNYYSTLDLAARKLEGAHPLAATLLRRAMIEDTLEGAESRRYRHAARHLMEADALAPAIPDYAGFKSQRGVPAAAEGAARPQERVLGLCR